MTTNILGVNTVTISGAIVSEFDLHDFNSGTLEKIQVVKFELAVPKWRPGNKPVFDTHTILVYKESLVDSLKELCSLGDVVLIEGKLTISNDKHAIIASRIHLVSKSGAQDSLPYG